MELKVNREEIAKFKHMMLLVAAQNDNMNMFYEIMGWPTMSTSSKREQFKKWKRLYLPKD